MTQRSVFLIAIGLSLGATIGWLVFGSHSIQSNVEAATTRNDAPRVHHILLEVSNMDASIAFYRDMMGFRPKSATKGFSILGGANVDIYLSTSPWDWKAPRGKDERLGLGMDVSSFRGRGCPRGCGPAEEGRLQDRAGAA